MFQCRKYKGGVRATTVILLKELEEAQEIHDLCKGSLQAKDTKGINSVHSIRFEEQEVVHRYFTNLDTGIKRISAGSQAWPELPGNLPQVGEVVDRHISNQTPIFLAFAENDIEDDDDEDSPDANTLAGRVYASVKKYSNDMDFLDDDDGNYGDDIALMTGADYQRQQAEQKQGELCEMFDYMSDISLSEENLFQEFDLEWPPKLELFWARKKNRNYLKIGIAVGRELQQMYENGKGFKNKALRYTAEQARQALRATTLKQQWDQQLICTVAKIKSFFGRKFRQEQEEHDEGEGGEQIGVNRRLVDAEELLANNQLCEQELMGEVHPGDKATTDLLKDAELKNFFKRKVQLLKAFIKARLLDDATDTSLDENMPRKGLLGDAKNHKTCEKTGGPLLVEWAYSLRDQPVRAKIPSAEDIRILEEFEQSENEPLEIRFNTVQEMLAQAHRIANSGVEDAFDGMEDEGDEERTCDIDDESEGDF
jgi:hypothetical protein